MYFVGFTSANSLLSGNSSPSVSDVLAKDGVSFNLTTWGIRPFNAIQHPLFVSSFIKSAIFNNSSLKLLLTFANTPPVFSYKFLYVNLQDEPDTTETLISSSTRRFIISSIDLIP